MHELRGMSKEDAAGGKTPGRWLTTTPQCQDDADAGEGQGVALEALQHAGLVTVEPALADTPSLILTLSQGEGRALRRLSLPEVLWV